MLSRLSSIVRRLLHPHNVAASTSSLLVRQSDSQTTMSIVEDVVMIGGESSHTASTSVRSPTRVPKRKRDPTDTREDVDSETEVNEARVTQQDTRQDADQMQIVDAAAATGGTDEPRPIFHKRLRLSFTDRAKSDVVTLPLAFSFLDAYSLLRCRRVCTVWRAASRRPLAWQHTMLACNIEWIHTLPHSSINMLRSICLVRDLKSPMPDMKRVFAILSGMVQLTSLRLEEVTLDNPLCDMLATYLPNLKQLDIKMASEFEDEEMKRKLKAMEPPLIHIPQMILPEGGGEPEANDDGQEPEADHAHSEESPVDPAVLAQHDIEVEMLQLADAAAGAGAVSTSSSSSFSLTSEYAEAVTFFRRYSSYSVLPSLQLPNLVSIKLPYSRSWGHVLAFTEPLQKLETLQIRRVATSSRTLDTVVSERHYLTIMNHRFRTRYADSLKHLSLMNIHYHTYCEYDLKCLNVLTHLSLTQNSNFRAITRECLEMISRMTQLQETEIRVGNSALEVCVEPEWWLALSSIRSLTSLSIWNPNGVVKFDDNTERILFTGLQLVTSSPHCRLQSLQLSNDCHINDQVVELVSHAKSLHTLSFYSADVTLASLPYLASLPQLTALEIIACRALHTSEGLVALIAALPRLRSLSFRLPSATTIQKQGALPPSISEEAWLQLPRLTSLTALHLSGYGQISDQVVRGWCRQAIEGREKRQKLDEATLKRFAGFEEMHSTHEAASSNNSTELVSSSSVFPPRTPAPAGGVPWQEVRCSGWMITTEQSLALLRSLPQLQMLSVHLLETSAGSFTSPTSFNARLLFGGGDYMQRQIASYISPPHVFK